MSDYEDNRKWREFLAYIGISLVKWQRVEDMHYLLFNKLTRIDDDELCSILYFSPTSFEARRALVDRIAQRYFNKSEHAENWKDLNNRLRDAAAQRNAVAHYSLNFEIIFDDPSKVSSFRLGAARLTPSTHNHIYALRGVTPDKDNYAVTSEKMEQYARSFDQLENDLKAFILAIPDRPQRPAKSLTDILLGPSWIRILNPSHWKQKISGDAQADPTLPQSEPDKA